MDPSPFVVPRIVHRIAPLSAARMYALVAGTLTLATAVARFLYAVVLFVQDNQRTTSAVTFIGSAALETIAATVSGLVVGGLVGLVGATVYNWWALKVGGVHIELEKVNQ